MRPMIPLPLLHLKSAFIHFMMLAAMMMLVAACGFKPLYDQSGANDQIARQALIEMGKIKIERIPNREGQLFRNALIASINPRGEPSNPKYRLATSLSHSVRSSGTSLDDDAARNQLVATGRFTLNGDSLDAPILFTSKIHVGFLVGSDGYVNNVARQDALNNALEQMVADARLQLAILLRDDS